MEAESKIKNKTLLVMVGIGLAVWLMQAPLGLERQGWQLLVIFFITVAGIIVNLAPMGILSLMCIAICVVTKTLSMDEVLEGFSESVVWLVVFAFFISRAVIKSNVGKRIAYYFISRLGYSGIGIAYGFILTELMLAPVIPSASARGGGIIFPIARSVSEQYAAVARNKREAMLIQYFIMKICFQTNIITSAMFLTAMVGNPLIAQLAHGIGVEIDWITWAKAAVVPGLINLALLPFIMFYAIKPVFSASAGAVEHAKTALKEMGLISKLELNVLGIFVCLLILWIFGKQLQINATATALLGFIALVLSGALTLQDAIKEKNAWDTFIWFGIFVMMSGALNKYGVIAWIGEHFGSIVLGLNPYIALAGLVLLFFYMHYFFASITVYATVMYTTFVLLLVNLGVPPLVSALLLAFLANISSCLTHYGITTAPIFFSASSMSVKGWWGIGLATSVANIIIWVIAAVCWWKIAGLC